jgi:predicted ATPase
MRITKVDIKNWRILHEPEALFQSSCAVIIGENGSGKSTLIELIMSVFDIVYKRLKRSNTLMELDGFCLEYVIKGDDNDDHQVRFECGYDEGSTSGELKIAIDGEEYNILHDGGERIKTLLPANIIAYYAGNTDRIDRICRYYLDENVRAVRKIDNEFNLLPLNMPSDAPFIYSDLWHMPVALASLLVAQQESRTLEKLNIREDSVTVNILLKKPEWARPGSSSEDFWGNSSRLFIDFLGGVIEKSFRKSLDANHIETEVSIMDLCDFLNEVGIEQKGVFLFQIFDLLYNNGLLDEVDVKWVRRGDGMNATPISCKYFSEGEKQVIMTSALIEFWDKQHCLFLFDEPDTFLHPKWQSRFLPEIQERLNESQAIITTHSTLMVSSVKQGSELLVMVNGKLIPFGRNTYGLDTNSINLFAMNTAPRSEEAELLLQSIRKDIKERRIEDAKNKLVDLEQFSISEIEMNRLRSTIERIEMIGR